ncbi:MAG: ABC transporter permease [Promethearchaeati archaeon SRVP18_Atabeyarchaeia-1]
MSGKGKDNLVALLKRDGRVRSKHSLRQVSFLWKARMKIFWSYKLDLTMDIVNAVISVGVYFFMGFQVNLQQLAAAGYGTSYIAFALVGVTTETFLWTSVSRISGVLRTEQEEGTLEAITSTMLKPSNYLFGQSLAGFSRSSIYFVGAMVVGIFLLQIPLILNAVTLATASIAVIMMTMSHIGIGFAAAGAILVLKRGEPIVFMFSVFTQFFSGVLYPLNVIPTFLLPIAYFLPYTYALHALRLTFGSGYSILSPAVTTDFIAMGVWTLVSVPIGIWVFKKAINHSRRVGTMSYY